MVQGRVDFSRDRFSQFRHQRLIFTCSGIFQGIGNTLPALAGTATCLLTFLVPVIWISKRGYFAVEHVRYLSEVTVTLQTVLSLVLLRRELDRRLPN